MRQATILPRLLLVAALLPLPAATSAQARPAPADTVHLRVEATALLADFRRRVRAAGGELPYSPRVRLRVTPQLIFFNDADSTIVVPWWAGLEPTIQASFTVLAGDSAAGQRLFRDLFNWFLLPHELTHALQSHYAQPWRPYASEAQANVGAVAYWMAVGAEGRLLALDSALARALAQLPDPTPAGADPAAYFDQNYEALGANPQAYGYYQFRFIRQAIAARRATPLDVLIPQVAKAP